MRAEQVAGSFVAVSSISARLVDRTMGLYCASKAALSMLVQVAAAEWGADGLRVNAVAPGVTRDTDARDGAPRPQSSPWLAGVARPHRAGPPRRGRGHRPGRSWPCTPWTG